LRHAQNGGNEDPNSAFSRRQQRAEVKLVLTTWRSRWAGTRWTGRSTLARLRPATAPPCARKISTTSRAPSHA